MLTGACGIVLAAGAGTRYGHPKALARAADGEPWVAKAVRLLEETGCAPVIVALGSRAAHAAPLVPDSAVIVVALDWAEGLSATLRTALAAAADTDAAAAVIVPVDTPDLPVEVVIRVASAVGTGIRSLGRAAFDGAPGHPVVLGREHWAAAGREARGDRGAGEFLRDRGAIAVECGDLWDGIDIDAR